MKKRWANEPVLAPFAAFRSLLHVLSVMLAPILLCAVTALLLLYPDQMKEVYRAIAQDLAFSEGGGLEVLLDYREVVLAASGLSLLGATFWLVARLLSLKFSDAATNDSLLARMAGRWVPILLAVLPLLCASWGVWHARTAPSSATSAKGVILSWMKDFYGAMPETIWRIVSGHIGNRIDSYRAFFSEISVALIGVAAALSILFVFLERLSNKETLSSKDHFLVRRQRFVLYAALLTLIVSIYLFPVALSQILGVIFIFSIFMIFLTLVMGQLSFWSQKMNFPFLGILVVLGLTFEFVGLNDDHKLRAVSATVHSGTEAAAAPAPTLKAEFARWYASRADRAYYEAKKSPYPIYVVSAEGGGIYAAYHAASFLGALQDQCPSFAHHLFAISSVSGGSLGASLFAAIASQAGAAKMQSTAGNPCRGDKPAHLKPGQIDENSDRFFDIMADQVFGHDLLSPLVASMLFPDFLQRFLPYPINGFDRARSIEDAFEGAWDDTLDKLRKKSLGFWQDKVNILSQPYRSHWRADGSSPALLLNTTEIATGRRRVISPFVFAEDKLRFLPIWNEPWAVTLKSDKLVRDIPLSTAAIVSARFPWVTPAGWFYDVPFESGRRQPILHDGKPLLEEIQLVDGGYFDNSGVFTALELIRSIKAAASEAGLSNSIRINLLVLTSAVGPDEPPAHATEVSAPVQALLAARIAAGRATVEEALHGFDGHGETGVPNVDGPQSVRKVELRDVGYPLPLGWRLSQMTRMLMRTQSGDRALCDKIRGASSPESYAAPACTVETVHRELSAVPMGDKMPPRK
ncbi:hypothetical protein [Bradyrhizobium manausense]|uniref:PNPLA domain-containing protein n=1 Tax=Bradyrhizobium manausense TaxID=989370 RepID=A0A0R3E2L5_9BRAD|nr:hypothetical protein [Bradyrhizobium manausense]KRQ14670.1 hypothetical protein AOQ71_12350 [Bradyrhizobium manausense]